MKTLYLVLCQLIIIPLCLSAQTVVPTLEIQTDDLASKKAQFIFDGTDRYTQYIYQSIEEGKQFRIKILKSTGQEKLTVTKSPKSKVHVQKLVTGKTPIDEQYIDVTLSNDESVEYEIQVDTASIKYVYAISLSTAKEFVPNANFIFLSAIRSIAGIEQTKEFFDLNLKFNYLKRGFTLVAMDLSLSPADSSQTRINEALFTANCFCFNKREKLIDGSLDRAAFAGFGLKVFDQEPYLGGHIGSLEINGPLFSSYAIIGYYRNAYGRYATNPQEKDPVSFRNNFYSEFALAFDNKKGIANILSDIRIKLGVLFPFTNSEKDIVKPLAKDTRYRLVVEVPIGGIFKFSRSGQSKL